jgi:FKBP-type peptidyl-prolyl cis-trans isomerase 2
MDRGKMVIAVMVAAILVSISAFAYVLYARSQANDGEDSDVIQIGDSVKLDYTGYTLEGRVFDTSILSIAHDDTHYPKSLTFTLRSNDSYDPIDNLQAGVYPGSYIEGFTKGVLGMHVGETKMIEVPPDEGYAVDPAMITTVDVLQEMPGTESFSEGDFNTLFGVEPILLRTIPHFFWQWDVIIVDNSSGYVTIKHQPTVGEVVYPFGDPFYTENPQGWGVVVEAYDPAALDGAGKVTVRHQVSEDDVYNVKGTDIDDYTFVLSAYDEVNGTFSVHRSDSDSGYNGELAGRTLFFEITILAVTPVSD